MAAGAALLAAVIVAHWFIGRWATEALMGFGPARAMPQRMQVAFVRELLPSAPPVAAAPPPLPPRPPAARQVQSPRAAAAPARAASLPVEQHAEAPADPASSPPEVSVREEAAAPSPPASDPAPADAADAASAALAAAPASAASAIAFDWPASTRLSYDFVGNYRGEVRGSAQVEWVRSGDRYQVHLDVVGGLSFAPLFTRRMTSDGLITAAGLSPLRYDEETKRMFADLRRATLLFDGGEIQLANGQRRPRPPGVQDAASQFVQLVWMFTLQPGLMKAGSTIEIPLALPRSVDTWVYDVVAPETLYTSFGPLESFHVKPRREARASGEMTVEIWFVPGLQYLPARIRIHQDAATFIDLTLSRPPLQAEPAASAASR